MSTAANCYLHIVDTLETAAAFDLRVRPSAGRHPVLEKVRDFNPYRQADFDDLISAWLPLTYAVNNLNTAWGSRTSIPSSWRRPLWGNSASSTVSSVGRMAA